MNKQETKAMQSFIDKLVDHLPMQRVKVLIDNGFDEWQTITYLKGEQLIQLGFNTEQCIVIMVAANSNALQNQQTQIFSQQKMQQIIGIAKQHDLLKQEQILKQQTQIQKKQNKNKSEQSEQNIGSIKSVPSSQNINIKEYPRKQITQALITKGTFTKAKQGQKINLSKLTMLSLQQKQITHITNLQKCPNLANLHLGGNYIYKIQNMAELTKIKVLKLQHNNISKIQNLDTLVNLEHLYLSSNYISRLENLQNNVRLQQLFISKQKINSNFTFDPLSMQALSYTLQKLQCNQNRIKNITNLKYLTVVKEVYLAKNQLQDIGQLSETINGMQSLKNLSFKDCPITKSQKYRDYIVILSKTLEELDGKKILAKQRQYLVKLYALKHAKQSRYDQKSKQKEKPKNSKNIDLRGVKLQQQQYGNVNFNINRATDLRGNVPHANTKHVKR